MKRGTILLMILTICLLLANLYYSQPVLTDIARSISLSPDMSGLIVTAAQLGYICGLLFIAPLGDFLENRKLCSLMALGAACAALLASFTSNAAVFLVSMLFMALFAAASQILIVFAISLAGPAGSGKILGIMACGLFLGIALSRPLSSLVSGMYGWQKVYLISGCCLLLSAAFLYRYLPPVKVCVKKYNYIAILKSMICLITYPGLMRRTLVSAGAFFCFIMYWSCMPMFLSKNMGYDQNSITLFTLMGLITPPAMLLVGKLLDKSYNYKIILTGLVLNLTGWAAIALLPSLLIVFIISALLVDPCSSAVTVSVQQKILSNVSPDTRGRLNSLNISMNFLGGALGGAIGPWLLSSYGLRPVLLTGAGVLLFLIITAIFDRN